MKRLFAIIFLCLVFCLVVFVGVSITQSNCEQNCVRLHIKANSNDEVDLDIETLILNEVSVFLLPVSKSYTTKKEFIEYVENNLFNICRIANEILAQNNLDYKISTTILSKYYNEQKSNKAKLSSGYYDTISICLGHGLGEEKNIIAYI